MSCNKEIREKANKLLKDNCLFVPPVNAKELALNMGLKVVFVDFNQTANFQDVSGFIHSSSRTLYVNANESPKRQNFTIAHEIGHYILGHTNSEEYSMLYRVSSITNEEDSNLEKEANYFAANLLVPEQFLKNIIKSYPGITDAQLGNMFFVSDIVIRYRRSHVGV